MQFDSLDLSKDVPKAQVVADIIKTLHEDMNYDFFEVNDTKPWGAYFRIVDEQADRFVEQFFPGLSPEAARMGREGVELSPKWLLVAPNQRLSWQKHDRRAERWHCLAGHGGYHKSMTDDQGELITFAPGDIVQFAEGERHRLVGGKDGYLLVAEIWQHTDPTNPSDEADIVRLADDYSR